MENLHAALTILTLGFDVLSQQILGLGDRLVPDATAIASVPRSEIYDLISVGSHTSFYPALSMKASIQTGIMTENIPEKYVQCSTGNCTWPTIPTLAVCGACINVTANLSRTNTQYPKYYEYTLPNECSWTGPGPDFFTSPTAPVDMFVSNQQQQRVNQDMNDVGDQPLYTAKFDVIGLPPRTDSMRAPNPANLHATECALWHGNLQLIGSR